VLTLVKTLAILMAVVRLQVGHAPGWAEPHIVRVAFASLRLHAGQVDVGSVFHPVVPGSGEAAATPERTHRESSGNTKHQRAPQTEPSPPGARWSAGLREESERPRERWETSCGLLKALYDAFSHGTLAKSEIASQLGISATSGPSAARVFTLRMFGLIAQSGSDLSVSDTFRDGGGTGQNGGVVTPKPHDGRPNALDMLSVEIPVGERKVVIRYPSDLSAAEAKKVGNVLAAVVG
jgi:hypothetical protein